MLNQNVIIIIRCRSGIFVQLDLFSDVGLEMNSENVI